MTPTDPATFHAALHQLLADHGVVALLGPRASAEGVPADDFEGRQDAVPRSRVTTLHIYSMSPTEVQQAAWWAVLNGLPGVRPYPLVVPHTLGGAQVTIRWLDGTPIPARLNGPRVL